MTISYPLSTPAGLGIRNVRMMTKNVVAVSESPFTLKQQTFEHAGKMWGASVTLPPMDRADAQKWIAFLLSLKGRLGSFLLSDPSGATPLGSASTTPGTPLVAGGSQTGNTLSIDGLPVSTTGYLLAGDYIQVGTGSGTQLYKCLADVDTDGGGAATIDIWPDIRTSPADNETVTVSNAAGLFRLVSNETEWSVDDAEIFGISFECVEVIT